jgi:hypothetical protein
MQRTQSVDGIANGHWERSEPRSAWLLMLARMGIAELRLLGDWAREHTDRRTDDHGSKETAH